MSLEWVNLNVSVNIIKTFVFYIIILVSFSHRYFNTYHDEKIIPNNSNQFWHKSLLSDQPVYMTWKIFISIIVILAKIFDPRKAISTI